MKHHFSAELQPIGIDEKNGIIRGAVACQAGLEARGHSLKTDGVLLRQLLMSAKAKGDKLPVHLDHKSGAAGCIGTAQAFRMDGDKLRCDLHFFRTHEKFNSTMELLSNLYETAGLSASFVGDAENGKARCRDFLACDVVVFPAAVAYGLFSALLDHVEHLEAENEQLQTALEALQDDDDDDDDEDDSDDDAEAVLSPKGAMAGPHGYSANLSIKNFDFASAIEENRRAGMDPKKAHVEALKQFARQKYQMLNL
jgi:hypothetical protein